MTTVQRRADVLSTMRALPADDGFAPISEAEVRRFQDQTGAAPGQVVVDIGTGYGEWACQLARLGLLVTGYDRCAHAVQWARQAHEGHGAALRFEHYDITVDPLRPTLRPGSADIVTFRHSLHHMDIPRLMTDVRRWLHPTGLVHLTTTLTDKKSGSRTAGLHEEELEALAVGWRERHRYHAAPGRTVAVILRGPYG